MQAAAPRNRRENALDTAARVNTAEGAKTTAILESEGRLAAARNDAEAARASMEAEARGYAAQIATLAEALGGDAAAAAGFLMRAAELRNLGTLAGSSNRVYVPTDMLRDGVKIDMLREGGAWTDKA
jgi:regulator of protease activity HflC (stomatin/prohibitin superfamily)